VSEVDVMEELKKVIQEKNENENEGEALDQYEMQKKIRISTCKVEGSKLGLAGNIYSLFYVSLINYDADEDSEMSKKGWLDLNKRGTDTM
jgi:hypothetical protein